MRSKGIIAASNASHSYTWGSSLIVERKAFYRTYQHFRCYQRINERLRFPDNFRPVFNSAVREQSISICEIRLWPSGDYLWGLSGDCLIVYVASYDGAAVQQEQVAARNESKEVLKRSFPKRQTCVREADCRPKCRVWSLRYLISKHERFVSATLRVICSIPYLNVFF